jgi:hypothetical protein
MTASISSFKSDRKFSVISYEISHGLLLFRSGRTDQHQSRIDILIRDVRAVELRSWSEGIEIEEVSSEYLVGCRSNPIEMIEPGNRVYALRGKGWQGFVVGGVLSVQEDNAEFMAPSGLIANRI